MKVDVITVEDAKFKKWSWWSNWIDVAIFDYSCQSFLIQMKVSRTNKKAFRSVCLSGLIYRQCGTTTVGNLTQMKTEVTK